MNTKLDKLDQYDPRISLFTPRGKQPKYWIRYYLPNGTRVRRPVGGNKLEAEKRLLAKQRQLLTGVFSDYDKERMPELVGFEKMTIEQATNFYLERTKLIKSLRTLENERWFFGMISKYFNNIGIKYIVDIKATHIERFMEDQLDRGLKKITVNDYLNWLRKLFNKLIDKGKLKNNPAKDVDLIPLCASERSRNVIFSLPDIRNLLNAPVNEEALLIPIRSLFTFMLNTGLRKGEAMHLEWEDIDLEQAVVHIHFKPQCPTANGLGWTPKWRKERVVFLNASALEVLKNLPRRTGVYGLIKGQTTEYPADFVFPRKEVLKHDCLKRCINCESGKRIIRHRNLCWSPHRALHPLR